MRIPSSVQGLIFAPTLICLFFVLKAFCPSSAGSSCFADQFAVPIFLPLVAIYKLFGSTAVIGGQEFLLIIVYWAFIGFLIGFIFDLLWRRKETVVEVREPEHPIPNISPMPAGLAHPPPSPHPVLAQNMQMPRPIVPLHITAPPTKLPLNLLDREEYKSKS